MGAGSATPGIPEELWRRAASARRRVLMLDYDGTLAPFNADRSEARPSAGAIAALRRIQASRRTEIAVVSGRPVADVMRLLGEIRVRVFGLHGWEMARVDGVVVRHPVPAAAVEGLDRAIRAARAADFGDQLETKRAAVVLHMVGMDARERRRAEELADSVWSQSLANLGLKIRPIHGGVELRASGRDKGDAVKEILAEAPPGAFAVYIGDDETDEDAFRAVESAGAGILVRSGDFAGGTLASARLASCDEVVRFLEHWLERVEETSAETGSEEPTP
jgi:trehalose-phosphatase